MTTTIKCENCGTENPVEQRVEGEGVECRSCYQLVIYQKPRHVARIDRLKREKQRALTQLALNTATVPNQKALLYSSLAMIAAGGNAWLASVGFLEKAKQENPMDAEIYYNLALFSLEGKRPMLHNIENITRILDNLNFAIQSAIQGKYYYLKALVIRDFYVEQYLGYHENFKDILEMAEAFGVTEEDKEEIFGMIPLQRPKFF